MRQKDGLADGTERWPGFELYLEVGREVLFNIVHVYNFNLCFLSGFFLRIADFYFQCSESMKRESESFITGYCIVRKHTCLCVIYSSYSHCK